MMGTYVDDSIGRGDSMVDEDNRLTKHDLDIKKRAYDYFASAVIQTQKIGNKCLMN